MLLVPASTYLLRARSGGLRQIRRLLMAMVALVVVGVAGMRCSPSSCCYSAIRALTQFFITDRLPRNEFGAVIVWGGWFLVISFDPAKADQDWTLQ
ncbi:hypothetical protein [Gordonia bronchialis]|uniref:hypothetical protein n=1 Tax=Gordonia bronchialis TaxID=2054 RepID=UPI00226DBE2C|nr:hypothetical protein [Gordonia bronchialis]